MASSLLKEDKNNSQEYVNNLTNPINSKILLANKIQAIIIYFVRRELPRILNYNLFSFSKLPWTPIKPFCLIKVLELRQSQAILQ